MSYIIVIDGVHLGSTRIARNLCMNRKIIISNVASSKVFMCFRSGPPISSFFKKKKAFIVSVWRAIILMTT